MSKYEGNANSGKPKSEYISRLTTMTDEELYDETKKMIWLSAYANNNPRSDCYWQCDATYDESKSRDKLDLYDRAYKYVSAEIAGR